MALTLYFVRHGEVHNPDQILYGRLPDFQLNAKGKRQAQAAASHLSGHNISAVYTSPMLRAQQTAQIVARPHQLPLIVDDRLNEVFTPHEGQKLADLERISFEIYGGNQPPYETLNDIRTRLCAFIDDMRSRYRQGNQTIIAVTHGDLVVLAFLLAVNYPGQDIGRNKLVQLGLPERYPANACLFQLHYTDDNWRAWYYERPKQRSS